MKEHWMGVTIFGGRDGSVIGDGWCMEEKMLMMEPKRNRDA